MASHRRPRIGWLERLRERRRLKPERTGPSPEKVAERHVPRGDGIDVGRVATPRRYAEPPTRSNPTRGRSERPDLRTSAKSSRTQRKRQVISEAAGLVTNIEDEYARVASALATAREERRRA
jgi:hypothetical protein